MKALKVIGDLLAFIGATAAVSFGSDTISKWFSGIGSSSKLAGVNNGLAQDAEIAAVVYGAIAKMSALLGLRSKAETAAIVHAIRLLSKVSPQSLNVLYTDGSLSDLDDVVKFSDAAAAKSWNVSGISASDYDKELARIVGTAAITSGSPTVGNASGEVTANPIPISTPGGTVNVPSNQVSPSIDAGGEATWSQVANLPSGVNMTDVGRNNVGVEIHTYILQQALILAGFGKGVFEGQNLPLLAITGVATGSAPNTIYFNQLLGDYCEAIGEPRRTSYNIKQVYQLYKDIAATGESSDNVNNCRTKLASYMDSLDTGIKNASSMYAFQRPRDKYAYGSVVALGSATEEWALASSGIPARYMINLERALIDIGYYACWDTPQSNRATWGGIDDDTITGGTIDGKLRLAQGTNGAYRNQKYSWVTVNNVMRALVDSGLMTDSEAKTYYNTTRAWDSKIGKAMRLLLEDVQPDSVMLAIYNATDFP